MSGVHLCTLTAPRLLLHPTQPLQKQPSSSSHIGEGLNVVHVSAVHRVCRKARGTLVVQARRSEDGAAFTSASSSSSEDGLGSKEEFSQERLMEDLERLRKKQELDNLRVPLSVQRRREEEEKERAKGNAFKEVLERILVADFFFICFALVWFLVGVGQQSVFRSSSVLDTFMPLWDPLIQPALGLFMAGALASGAVGYLNREKD